MEVRSQSRSGLADGPANAVLSELARPGRSFTALIEGQLRVNLTHPRRRRRPTGICARRTAQIDVKRTFQKGKKRYILVDTQGGGVRGNCAGHHSPR